MKTYALKIGLELCKVRGIINAKGWLEWKQGDAGGIAKPGTFCSWNERKGRFPECNDEEARDREG